MTMNPKRLQATAEIQVIPMGEGVSVRRQIERVVQLLNSYPLIVETHASGTNLEGEMEIILKAVDAIHRRLHEEGTIRIVSYLKLETRIDKASTLAGKKLA